MVEKKSPVNLCLDVKTLQRQANTAGLATLDELYRPSKRVRASREGISQLMAHAKVYVGLEAQNFVHVKPIISKRIVFIPCTICSNATRPNITAATAAESKTA